jgi:hypothetical protein
VSGDDRVVAISADGGAVSAGGQRMAGPTLTRERLRIGALLALVFACGMLAGAAVWQLRMVHVFARLGEGPTYEFEGRVKLFLLDRRVHLTDDERGRIAPIIFQHTAQERAVRRTLEPQLKPLRDQERAEVRAQLSPEQLPVYDEMLKQVDHYAFDQGP